jgi:hypothetical protein
MDTDYGDIYYVDSRNAPARRYDNRPNYRPAGWPGFVRPTVHYAPPARPVLGQQWAYGPPQSSASYFGKSATPAYAGAGQPSSTARGLLGISTPAYAAAPVRAPLVDAEIEADAEECVEGRQVVMCPIDSEALAAGQIAIVVPRQE